MALPKIRRQIKVQKGNFPIMGAKLPGSAGTWEVTYWSPARDLLRHPSGAYIFEMAPRFLQNLCIPGPTMSPKGNDTNLFNAVSSKDQTQKSRIWNYAEIETGDIRAQNQTPRPAQLCGLVQLCF